jgi:hypothetical protein
MSGVIFTHGPSKLEFSIVHWTDFTAYITAHYPYAAFSIEVTPNAMSAIDGWLTLRLIQYVKWLEIDNVCAVAKDDVIQLVVWNMCLLNAEFRSVMATRYPEWFMVNGPVLEQADKKLNAWRAADAAMKDASE